MHNESSINDEVTFLSKKILDLNKQLMESEKAKTLFLSLIANELNNPMTALLGLIPHLFSMDGQRREKTIALIEAEALHLNFHIQNLVAAAEIENGNINLSYAQVDPESLIDDVLKALKYWMEEAATTVELDNRLQQKIVTDPQKLYLILINLVANACRYGKAGTAIRITFAEEDGKVRISVKNFGKGPQVEYKPQVFTRFSHAPGEGHGLGIGLSIVRELCEWFEGSIDYNVDETEESVTFTVLLPLKAEAAASEAFGSNDFMFESFEDAIEL